MVTKKSRRKLPAKSPLAVTPAGSVSYVAQIRVKPSARPRARDLDAAIAWRKAKAEELGKQCQIRGVRADLAQLTHLAYAQRRVPEDRETQTLASIPPDLATTYSSAMR